MEFDRIIELLKSDDYRSRAIGEYHLLRKSIINFIQ